MIQKQELPKVRPLSNDEYRMLHQVQAFPRILYKEDTSQRIVHSEVGLEESLKEGWSLTPFPPAPAPIALSAEDTLELLMDRVEDLHERLQAAEEKLNSLKPSVFTK